MRKLTRNTDPAQICRITLAEAAELLPTPDGKRSATVMPSTWQASGYYLHGLDLFNAGKIGLLVTGPWDRSSVTGPRPWT